MSKLIKFKVNILDSDHKPCRRLSINCKAYCLKSKTELQFFYLKLDEKGQADFEFECDQDAAEIELEVSGNKFKHVFSNGEEATFRMPVDQ